MENSHIGDPAYTKVDSARLPTTDCNVRMPTNVISNTGQLCDSCVKEDVCIYKDECYEAVKDILDIEERKNVFIKTRISCEKWSGKAYVATR